MKDQYIIISGTNRKDSNTYKIALEYQKVLRENGFDAEILSLENVDLSDRNAAYEKMEQDYLLPATKYVFIAPEYNASIPGVLKTLLDLSDYKKVWAGKKALLVGVASGRAGNVRGLEHLTSILHYMNVNVHPNKLPISSVLQLLNDSDGLHDASTMKAINSQLQQFIKY